MLLVGDLTAVPAINSWLATLPADLPVQVVVEDGHDDVAALPVVSRPGATWEWVAPSERRGEALAKAVTAAAARSSGAGLFAWGAGERTLVKALRGALRDDLGLDRAHHFTQYYWMAGKPSG